MTKLATNLRKLWQLVDEERWWLDKQYRIEIAKIATMIVSGEDPFRICSNCGKHDTVYDSNDHAICCGHKGKSINYAFGGS